MKASLNWATAIMLASRLWDRDRLLAGGVQTLFMDVEVAANILGSCQGASLADIA